MSRRKSLQLEEGADIQFQNLFLKLFQSLEAFQVETRQNFLGIQSDLKQLSENVGIIQKSVQETKREYSKEEMKREKQKELETPKSKDEVQKVREDPSKRKDSQENVKPIKENQDSQKTKDEKSQKTKDDIQRLREESPDPKKYY